MFGGVFGKLFGTEKAVDNMLDKDNGLLVRAGGWVDGLSYTDEEKADMNLRTRQWASEQLNSLQPFKVVQRILAFSVCALWIVNGLNVMAANWIEAIYAIQVKDDALAFAMSDYIFWPVLSVFALYFTGGVVESAKRKLK